VNNIFVTPVITILRLIATAIRNSEDTSALEITHTHHTPENQQAKKVFLFPERKKKGS